MHGRKHAADSSSHDQLNLLAFQLPWVQHFSSPAHGCQAFSHRSHRFVTQESRFGDSLGRGMGASDRRCDPNSEEATATAVPKLSGVLVLCLDEKSQAQALDRTRAVLPFRRD
jgi:hypothetical protein